MPAMKYVRKTFYFIFCHKSQDSFVYTEVMFIKDIMSGQKIEPSKTKTLADSRCVLQFMIILKMTCYINLRNMKKHMRLPSV